MRSFHAEKCCHLVSGNEASAARLCKFDHQFLICSTLILYLFVEGIHKKAVLVDRVCCFHNVRRRVVRKKFLKNSIVDNASARCMDCICWRER